MAYRKHFSFTEKEVYEHVINQRNASAYIEDLVKKDMNKVSYATINDVKQMIEQVKQLQIFSPSPTEPQHDLTIHNEAELVMSSVQSILDLGGS